MSLDKDLDRGALAESLLSNDAFKQAVTECEQTIHNAWAACPVRDIDGAHQLRLMLKSLADIVGLLEACVDNGKSAAEELERIRGERNKILSPREWRGN
jgi:hypothetical protein